MSFILEHIGRIVDGYKGDLPLAPFLKNYFRQHSRLGSRDRKALSEAAYIYYRCRRFFPHVPDAAAVVRLGIDLCRSDNAFLKKMLHYDEGQTATTPDMEAAAADTGALLSPGMPARRWLGSLWQQPQVFIRLRGQQEQCLATLREHDIPFGEVQVYAGHTALRIGAGAALDSLLPEDAYVVQDLSSQRSVYGLPGLPERPPLSVWDVCSGAGGKSLLLKDTLPSFRLLATDIRDSILHNLRGRFRKYGFKDAETMVLDSADGLAVKRALGGRSFDLVLCDVPCSGSGTWARTPEQFHFFRAANLSYFTGLQFPIAFNAAQHVRAGGTFAYITCSVFQAENEDVVARLQQHTGLQLVTEGLIDGIDQQADCMYAAFFRAP